MRAQSVKSKNPKVEEDLVSLARYEKFEVSRLDVTHVVLQMFHIVGCTISASSAEVFTPNPK
jgi:hypothetical protein